MCQMTQIKCFRSFIYFSSILRIISLFRKWLTFRWIVLHEPYAMQNEITIWVEITNWSCLTIWHTFHQLLKLFFNCSQIERVLIISCTLEERLYEVLCLLGTGTLSKYFQANEWNLCTNFSYLLCIIDDCITICPPVIILVSWIFCKLQMRW